MKGFFLQAWGTVASPSRLARVNAQKLSCALRPGAMHGCEPGKAWIRGDKPAPYGRPACGLPVGLHASDIGAVRRNAEFAFQRGDARFQRLVFLPRQPRHVLDCLEFLALDHVEVAQDFFGPIAPERIDLSLHALCCARSIVHQATDLVKEPIAGLGHRKNSGGLTPVCALSAPENGYTSGNLQDLQ